MLKIGKDRRINTGSLNNRTANHLIALRFTQRSPGCSDQSWKVPHCISAQVSTSIFWRPICSMLNFLRSEHPLHTTGPIKRRDIMRSSVALITQTVVDANDPAFQDPTKPVGAFLTEDEAVRLANETGATFKEDAGRGWRQVVASPAPVRIVEFDAIKDLVDDGYLVVSTGGGGVPVVEEDGGYRGVPAVIDKDRSSAKLAADFKADMLVILTAVPKVAINFNTPDQQDLDVLTVAEAAQYIEEGQFAPGSMLPKVEACIAYLQAYPEGKAIITSLENAAEAIEGESGTLIVA